MKFALACNGTRGDCEPSLAVGRELQRRGHDVRMGVPPGLIGLAESVGLAAVAYGPDTDSLWDADFFRDFTKKLWRRSWTIREPIKIVQELWEPLRQSWSAMNTDLTSLADGVDVLSTGLFFQDVPHNVGECYNIPVVGLHYYPMRPNGRFLPIPSPLARSAMTAHEWFVWLVTRHAEEAQRRELGLPKATKPAGRRVAERGSLEIQAYDEICFPGLAAEWAELADRRPFVGALTLDLPSDADDEAASWIAAGSPPIFFGFGSMPVKSPADTVEMIAEACTRLGERALVCSGWTDYDAVPNSDHVKVVSSVNYAKILPTCRAVVHHGGSGTTAAALRAGIPELILWTAGDQPFWGAALKRLEVGTSRRLLDTTRDSLVADLRQILAPRPVTRARELAARMTPPADSVAKTADLMEGVAQ